MIRPPPTPTCGWNAKGPNPYRRSLLVVQTPAGYLTASESEFTVVARADTTDVEVHALPGRPPITSSPMLLAPVIEPVDVDQILV
jgi:hypothetical protein